MYQFEIMEDYVTSNPKISRKKTFERKRDPKQKRNFDKYVDLSFYDVETNFKYNW